MESCLCNRYTGTKNINVLYPMNPYCNNTNYTSKEECINAGETWNDNPTKDYCNGEGSCKAGVCECNKDRYGLFCESICTENICNSKGTEKCQGTCICHNDKTNGYWYGFDCSKCLGEQNSKTKGYTGANCNISCENNYCNNHGQCLGEQTCTCDNKYTGDTCNKCMDNVIDEKGDGSLCQTCKDGFTGENCEKLR